MLVEVKNISKSFGAVAAVADVSFAIDAGETLALVGQSGCGKSTIARLILRLLDADAGCVFFDGINILNLSSNELRKMRANFQIVFQDPYTSLNPRMRVDEIITEPLKVHGMDIRNKTSASLLEMVGLSPNYLKRYPHELSGGERQRVGITRALTIKPKFVIADEIVSSLDTTTQAQIVNLLKRIKREMNLTLLFIAHDLAVVAQICDRVAVMDRGSIVEIGSKEKIYRNPAHPYTKKLLSAVPCTDPALSRLRKD